MDKHQRSQLEEFIKAQIVKTKKNVESYREMSKPIGPGNAIGRVSRMDAINNKSVTEAALRQAERKLDRLRKALNHIDRPGFGICIKCNNEIDIKRLMYMPESTCCMRCAR